ncbi:MAG TPA: hypothetical protein VHM20_02150, partial [Gammaproteobacteria bacterium]|jgi:hypothetical protein|nr:hypothetical protein [Gammaproteobacteria bacterium]
LDLKNYKDSIVCSINLEKPSFPVTVINDNVEELYDKENLKKWCITQARQRGEYKRDITNLTGTPLNNLQIRTGYPYSVIAFMQRVRTILEENQECKNNSSFPISFFLPPKKVHREAKSLFDDKKADETIQMFPTTAPASSPSLFHSFFAHRLTNKIMNLRYRETLPLLTEDEIKAYERVVGNQSERDLNCIQCCLSFQPVRFPVMVSDGTQSVLCDRDTLLECLRIKSDFRLLAFPSIPIKDLKLEARYPHTQEIISTIAMVRQTVQSATISGQLI